MRQQQNMLNAVRAMLRGVWSATKTAAARLTVSQRGRAQPNSRNSRNFCGLAIVSTPEMSQYQSPE